MLPTSRNDIACCKVNSPFSCFAGLLGIAQIGAQWGCFFLMYVFNTNGDRACKWQR